jgi:hypothetical protein
MEYLFCKFPLNFTQFCKYVIKGDHTVCGAIRTKHAVCNYNLNVRSFRVMSLKVTYECLDDFPSSLSALYEKKLFCLFKCGYYAAQRAIIRVCAVEVMAVDL